MNDTAMHRLLIFLLSFQNLLFAYAIQANEMSPQQRRGQQIYLTGKSTSGQSIEARLNDSGAQLPASLIPCVNCHNYDGKGIPEGGIKPANIQWHNLTKPYGITRQNGNKRLPYNERNLKKAISMGVDSSGNRLNHMMPRYQMTHNDMLDLIAFLKILGNHRVAGINEDEINIGVILPRYNSEKKRSVENLLNIYFNDLNKNGGIYQRHIKLKFFEPPDQNDTKKLSRFRSGLFQSEVFAFVASDINGIEPLVTELTEKTGIPFIGAYSQSPQLDFPLNRYVFYLLSGLKTQTLALENFAEKNHTELQLEKAIKPVVIIDNDIEFERLANQLRERYGGKKSKLQTIKLNKKEKPDKRLQTLLNELKRDGTNLVYLLSSNRTQINFFDTAKQIKWWPNVLIPGSNLSGYLFNTHNSFNKKIFVAMPNLPLDYKSSGIDDYQRLLEQSSINPRFRNTLLLAISSAKLLKEGLTRIGRKAEQEKLISALESLYEFDTQLTPPISYGPNRRLGASGAYIVNVDVINRTIIPVSKWLEVK